MNRLLTASLAFLPLLVASCQVPSHAGMSPTSLPSSDIHSTRGTGAGTTANQTVGSYVEQESAAGIAKGEVGNAISGTIELPLNLKGLARLTNGSPPVTLHVFRLTGPVIREAKVRLFWKDDRAIGFVVDGVPSDYPVVLAATIEPGVVIRALVPKASVQRPARGQTLNELSETIVLECYTAGIIPPVGLGGIAEVIRQGGLDPELASEANLRAATALKDLAQRPEANTLPAMGKAAAELENLAQVQLEVSNALRRGGDLQSMTTSKVFEATKSSNEALLQLEAEVLKAGADSKLPV